MRDRQVFMWQSVEILNNFNTLTLKQIFWKTKTFFKKLWDRFLVENTKIENASVPYKTVISEANIMTNRMVSTKWTYHKERSFASNYFIFLKVLFQLKNLFQRVDLMYQMPRFLFFVSAGVLFDGAFSLWVSLKQDQHCMLLDCNQIPNLNLHQELFFLSEMLSISSSKFFKVFNVLICSDSVFEL